MPDLLQDVRYAFRQLARTAGLSAVMVVTLALGIGATTTMFVSTNAVLFLGVAAVLAGSALAACIVPARRAARVPPVEALRYE